MKITQRTWNSWHKGPQTHDEVSWMPPMMQIVSSQRPVAVCRSPWRRGRYFEDAVAHESSFGRKSRQGDRPHSLTRYDRRDYCSFWTRKIATSARTMLPAVCRDVWLWRSGASNCCRHAAVFQGGGCWDPTREQSAYRPELPAEWRMYV